MQDDGFEHLYTSTIDQVFRYVYSRVRNRELAEDIVSEACVKAAEHWKAFVPREHASARSWLFTIVRNAMHDHFRIPATAELFDEHASDSPSVEHAVDTDLAHAKVMRALDTLPNRQREILLLRFQSQLRNKEIAELLQIDERSVSAALSKALIILRQTLYV